MNELPHEILSHLLDYCKPCELFRYRGISKLFYTICDNLVYKKLIISLFIDDVPDNSHPLGVDNNDPSLLKYQSQTETMVSYTIPEDICISYTNIWRNTTFDLYTGEDAIIYPLKFDWISTLEGKRIEKTKKVPFLSRPIIFEHEAGIDGDIFHYQICENFITVDEALSLKHAYYKISNQVVKVI